MEQSTKRKINMVNINIDRIWFEQDGALVSHYPLPSIIYYSLSKEKYQRMILPHMIWFCPIIWPLKTWIHLNASVEMEIIMG